MPLFGIVVLIFLLLAFGSLIPLLASGSPKKVFHRKTMLYIFGTALIFALFGLSAFLGREKIGYKAFWILFFLLTGFLVIGVAHRFLLYRILAWPSRTSFLPESFFTLFLNLLGALTFFLTYGIFEQPGWSFTFFYADNLAQGSLLFSLPFFVLKSFDTWASIPYKEVIAWKLNVEIPPLEIEPGRAIILHFHVPRTYQSKEAITFNTRAPIDKTVGEMFHYLLYRHNVQRKAYNAIEIAENKSKAKVYSWLFYKTGKVFFFFKKKLYLDPNQRVKEAGLKNGDIVFARRLKSW